MSDARRVGGQAARAAAWMFVVLLAASTAQAQGPTGPEFRVNDAQGGWDPSIAVRGDGGFLMAWSASGVQARVFDPAGAPLEPQFQVTAGSAGHPSVAATPGGFVLAWSAQDGVNSDVMARRFDPSGHAVGDEFRVSAGTPSRDGAPRVAAAADGSFVVAWANYSGADGSDLGVFGRRYSPGAVALGPPFQVNTYTTGRQGSESLGVAVAGDGGFAIVWLSNGVFGAPRAVSGQSFDGAGERRGAEFQLHEGTGVDLDSGPAIAADAAGGFVVAWAGKDPPQIPSDIVVRQVSAAGTLLGSEVHIDDTPFAHALWPTLVPVSGGRFVALWRSWLRIPWDPDQDLRARVLDGSGVPVGPEFRVGARLLGTVPAAAAGTPDGGFIAAWVPPLEAAVYARRFAPLGPGPGALVGAGNGVLEPGESAVLAPAWTNFGEAPVPALTAQAHTFTGPGDGPYTITDGQAAFGTVPAGATASCATTGDCYGVAVGRPATRPALHWDATLFEELSTGQQQLTSVHVGESFADVPPGSPFYRSVETALHRGLTSGCGGGAFCPDTPITRGQMSLFVLVAREGAGFRPYDCSPGSSGFLDVPTTHPFCPWIDELGWRGVVTGCGNGNFCPDAPVTRAEAAVFVLLTIEPIQPPACTTPVFSDLPAASPFCRWVEELARRGVVAGCGGGRYCPDAPTTRGQMAAILTAAFGLGLY